MNVLEGIDFGTYESLYQLMKDPSFNFNSLTKLDFTGDSHTDVPHFKVLQLLPKLRTFILSKNKISRFSFQHLNRGASLLQEIDLTYNNITVLDDIIELGCLKHLRVLNLRKNPVAKKFLRTKLIEYLLFPNKYMPYDGVKILTASYEYVPNKHSKPLTEEKKFQRVMEQTEEELAEQHERVSRICKYDHQATLIKLSIQPCPVPRKTRFPMLTLLNEKIISVQEIQSIVMTEDLSEILEDPNRCNEENQKFHRENEEMHRKYLAEYAKKKDRKKQLEAKDKKVEGEEIDNYMTKINKKEGGMEYENEMWKKPDDVKYKDAEFTIGMSDYKKMVREYEEKKSMRKMMEDEQNEFDKDLRGLLRKKVKSKVKPKLNLKMIKKVDMDTSDSSLEELQDEDERGGWNESNFLDREGDSGVDTNRDNNDDGIKLDKRESDSKSAKSPKIKRNETKKWSLLKSALDQGAKNGVVLKDLGKGDETASYRGGDETRKSPAVNAKATFLIPLEDEEPTVLPESASPSVKLVTKPKRGRTFMVVNKEEPNLSLPIFERSKKKVKIPNLKPRGSRYLSSAAGIGSRKSLKSSRRSEKKESSVEPLGSKDSANSGGTQDQSPATDLLSVPQGLGQSPLSGFSRQPNMNGLQPEQNPATPFSDLVGSPANVIKGKETYSKANRALAEFLNAEKKSGEMNNKMSSQSALIYADNSRAMDILLPANMKPLEYRASVPVEIQTPYTPDKIIRVFNNDVDANEGTTPINDQQYEIKNSFHAPERKSAFSNGANALSVSKEENTGALSKDDTTKDFEADQEKSPSVLNSERPKEPFFFPKKTKKLLAPKRFALMFPKSKNSLRISNSMNTTYTKSATRFTSLVLKEDSDLLKVQNLDPIKVDTTPSTVKAAQSPAFQRPSLSLVHSPTAIISPKIRVSPTIQIIDNTYAQSPTFGWDQSPRGSKTTAEKDRMSLMSNIFAHMSKKAEEAMPSPTSKQTKLKIQDPKKVMISTTGKPKTATNTGKGRTVEDLIPLPVDGVSEELRMRMLNNRSAKYKQLIETAKMLDETEQIIQEANELADRVSSNLKKPKMETVEPRILSFKHIAEFLRMFTSQGNLEFKDNKDLRELGELVNEFKQIEERGLKKTEIESRVRDMKVEALNLEGSALENKYQEIDKLDQYLEILENIEGFRKNVRHANQIDNLLEREITRAEHNAILATHYLKLKKYCGDEYLNRFMNDELRRLHEMDEDDLAGDVDSIGFKTMKAKLAAQAAKKEAEKRQRIKDIDDIEGFDLKDKDKAKKRENLAEYIRRINEEKSQMTKDYPYIRQVPMFTDHKYQWLNFSLVKKYEPKTMLGVDELTEINKRKMQASIVKKNSHLLSAEEKAIKNAEEFRARTKQKRMLKAKVESYIKEGTRNVDKMLEKETTEIPERFDKKQMFNEYMKLLWNKKL